ncbi:MAG TPA: polysaccharide biosynthesis/export family protein [Gammaproteobacteria bacterium]
MKKNIIKLILASAIFIFTQTSNAGPTVSGNEIPSYLIGPGDILEISVWKEEGLQKEVLVRPDGGISFPLVGEIQAGGKTTVQLQDTIVKNIKRYIPDPVVTISVLKINDNKIFVVGKVNRAGEFVATHYIDVMQALSMAGGLNPYAKSGDINILRRVNGKTQAIPFEYDAVAQGDKLEQNIILKSGDVVVVP